VLGISTSLGRALRDRLPSLHLNAESKEVIRLATAIVGTLSALALGLLIASAKSDYDTAQNELDGTAAHIVLLDRLAAANDARVMLRDLIQIRLDRGWTIEASDDNDRGTNTRVSADRSGPEQAPRSRSSRPGTSSDSDTRDWRSAAILRKDTGFRLSPPTKDCHGDS
jgi:hypothetical protein